MRFGGGAWIFSHMPKKVDGTIPVRGFAFLLVALTLYACAADAPVSRQVGADPLLQRQGGVLLLLDASVQIETLTGKDYFVLDEAKAGAKATVVSLRRYAEESDIPVRGEIVTIAGARLNEDGSPILVADSAGKPTRLVQQPLSVPDTIAADQEYVDALRVMSTYAMERAAIEPGKKKLIDEKQLPQGMRAAITIDEFRKAAAMIKARTQASSVLFLGVLGKSRSDSLEVADFLGRFIISGGVAVATAGLGTGYYVMFIPGHLTGLDGMILEGALVDLDTGQLTWSNAVLERRDPIHPENMANTEGLDLLFHGLMFQTKPVTANPIPTQK